MDLVINHCSDQHVWFKRHCRILKESMEIIFILGKGKTVSHRVITVPILEEVHGEKVKGTDYYYLHLFAKEQPDLNWYNPKVKEELYSMINWWLDKGTSRF